jgi:hypothetical protein
MFRTSVDSFTGILRPVLCALMILRARPRRAVGVLGRAAQLRRYKLRESVFLEVRR